MQASEIEYQRIVNAKIERKMEARIKAIALRARADAKRQARTITASRKTDRAVFHTAHGPAYTVKRWAAITGPYGKTSMNISLPYVSILGGQVSG